MRIRDWLVVIGVFIFIYGFSPQNTVFPDAWKFVGLIILILLYLTRGSD